MCEIYVNYNIKGGVDFRYMFRFTFKSCYAMTFVSL